jgi:hypothetical protein
MLISRDDVHTQRTAMQTDFSAQAALNLSALAIQPKFGIHNPATTYDPRSSPSAKKTSQL